MSRETASASPAGKPHTPGYEQGRYIGDTTGLHAFVERTGADELMITSQIFDHEARMRSYEITAQAVQTA